MSLCTRCRTAASESPTRLPISAYERRPSFCSCSMIAFDTSSSATGPGLSRPRAGTRASLSGRGRPVSTDSVESGRSRAAESVVRAGRARWRTVWPWRTPPSATSSPASTSPRTCRHLRPRLTRSTEAVYGTAGRLRPRAGRRRVPRGAATRVRGPGARRRRPSASSRCSASRTRWRRAPRSSPTLESKDTGKPLREPRRPTRSSLSVDQIRFFAGRRPGARGPVGGRVPEGPHVDDPARADRRDRPGDALELPAQHGGRGSSRPRSPPATRRC